jgi:hypothetical protein
LRSTTNSLNSTRDVHCTGLGVAHDATCMWSGGLPDEKMKEWKDWMRSNKALGAHKSNGRVVNTIRTHFETPAWFFASNILRSNYTGLAHSEVHSVYCQTEMLVLSYVCIVYQDPEVDEERQVCFSLVNSVPVVNTMWMAFLKVAFKGRLSGRDFGRNWITVHSSIKVFYGREVNCCNEITHG